MSNMVVTFIQQCNNYLEWSFDQFDMIHSSDLTLEVIVDFKLTFKSKKGAMSET